MHISIADARQLAETFLQKSGIAPTDAAIIADILLEAELRGRKRGLDLRSSHKSLLVPWSTPRQSRLPAKTTAYSLLQ